MFDSLLLISNRPLESERAKKRALRNLSSYTHDASFIFHRKPQI